MTDGQTDREDNSHYVTRSHLVLKLLHNLIIIIIIITNATDPLMNKLYVLIVQVHCGAVQKPASNGDTTTLTKQVTNTAMLK